jgi:AcrR family transcriptional regulator
MPTSSPTASRRRGDLLEHAILDAAFTELLAVGYPKLTIEAVAARAQTSKPVIYRRWRSRAALILAAMRHSLPDLSDLEDTGSLRTDLIDLLRRVAHRFDDVPGDTLPGLLTETFSDPEAAAAVRARITAFERSRLLVPMLERAVARGEISTAEVPPRVQRVAFDLLRNESMIYGIPVSDTAVIEIVDQVLLPLLGQG